LREATIAYDFTARQRDHAEVRMKYDLACKKWDILNRKCLMVAKSTISNAIRGYFEENILRRRIE
jgi:hypothetical protein